MRITLSLVLALLLAATSLNSWTEEPTIIIRNEEQKTLYEYYVNGELVEIKVVPSLGKPYYLVPAEGLDGSFDRLEKSKLRVPSWVIFRW